MECKFCVSQEAAYKAIDGMIEAVRADKDFHPEEDFGTIGRLKSAQLLLSDVSGYCMCGEEQPERN